MKKIKLSTKLVLNKETVSKLNDSQLRKIEGGLDTGGVRNTVTQPTYQFCNTNINCTTGTASGNTLCATEYNCATQYFCVPPRTK